MEKIVTIISFLIANVIGSLLCVVIYKKRYPNANKYLMFIIFFIGYCIFFYSLVKK